PRSATRSGSGATTCPSPSGAPDGPGRPPPAGPADAPCRARRFSTPTSPHMGAAAMTLLAPGPSTDARTDPRDPLLRLRAFFDPGTVELLHDRDRSGVLAAAGRVRGTPAVAFCTDGTVMGGAMGADGCRRIVDAYETALARSI